LALPTKSVLKNKKKACCTQHI